MEFIIRFIILTDSKKCKKWEVQMRIVFMGTPDFAVESLSAIYNAGHEILGVVTNPDKPKGRGMKMIASPVKEFAVEHNLKVFQPIKIKKNEEFYNEMYNLKPDLFCVVAYGKILPNDILKIPKYGAINVHGSLLPKYRGAAPIQMAVINGDEETGVTTMFMDAGMDTGDMILSEKVKIGDDETTGELWDRLSKIGARLLVKTLEKIEKEANNKEIKELESKLNDETNKDFIDEKAERKVEKNSEKKVEENIKEKLKENIKELVGARKQGDNFTVAPMLTKEMAEIDWNKTGREIHNLVRGLSPKIGAYTFYNGKKIKIWKTQVIKEDELEEIIKNSANSKNGEIIFADKKNGIVVKTPDGAIRILEIQAENSKRMTSKDFLNGNRLEINTVLTKSI
jgi:methionyl-tRNA formyltransferase